MFPDNALTALKLCGNTGYKFTNITIENVQGSTTDEGFYFRKDTNLDDMSADSIIIRDVNLTQGIDYPLIRFIGNNFGNLIFENMNNTDNVLLELLAHCNIESLTLNNIQQTITSASNGNTTYGIKYDGDQTVAINNLFINNCDINTSKSTFEEFLRLENYAIVRNIFINNVNISFIDFTNGMLINSILSETPNICISNFTQTRGVNIIKQTNKTCTYESVIQFLNVNVNVVNSVEITTPAKILLNNFYSQKESPTFKFRDATATYRISGNLDTNFPNDNSIDTSSVALAVYVNGNIPVDITQPYITAIRGDSALNTNDTILTGKGRYIYDVFDWKSTTRTYTKYISANYTVEKYVKNIYVANATTGIITVTLPAPSAIKGKKYTIKNASTYNVNVVDASSTFTTVLSPGVSTEYISIGTSWSTF